MGTRVLRARTRFSDSEHVSPKFSEFGVRSFGKTCSEWEHVSPTQNTFQNTFLRNFRSLEFGVRSFGKTCSEWEHVSPTQSTFLRRTRFSEIFVIRGSEFLKNVSEFGKTSLRPRIRFFDSEHVSPKFSEFRSSEFWSFGKTCSEWEHVSPTQNTFLRNFWSSEF